MTGSGDLISNLKKLPVTVLTACWSTLLHLMFWCERVFWQTGRFISRQLSAVRSLMQRLAERLSQFINLEWLSTYPFEDTTEKTFLHSASKQGLGPLVSTKHSSTLIQEKDVRGESGKGIKHVWSNIICSDWWRNWFDCKSFNKRHRHLRGFENLGLACVNCCVLSKVCFVFFVIFSVRKYITISFTIFWHT